MDRGNLVWRDEIKRKEPLVHCLTNHISMTDCANVLLALGARPIMAEHPLEVEEITAGADALVCNLGNLSDSRMESILRSGPIAGGRGIPVVLDLVGAGCSRLRLDFARQCISRFHPDIIKGNMSECKALAGAESHARGIDVGREDALTGEQVEAGCAFAAQLACRYGCTVAISGEHDLISDGARTYAVSNGCEDMGRITGTGCMLGVVLAACACAFPKTGAERTKALAFAAAMFGLCGQRALRDGYLGSGRFRLIDEINRITDEEILEEGKVKAIETESKPG